MSIEALLSKLEKVKQSSRGNWIACCPAHPDKHPSLTVYEADDGRVLVHCFGGCAVEQVLSAVGLDFDALFPPRAIAHNNAQPARLTFNARNVLEAIGEEITICALFTSDVRNGIAPSDADCRRFLEAAERIEQARRYANGG